MNRPERTPPAKPEIITNCSGWTCPKCGNKKDELGLDERTYKCDKCGLIINRDLNAARNLAQYIKPLNKRGLPGELSRLVLTVNQEAGIRNV
jgi:transposase